MPSCGIQVRWNSHSQCGSVIAPMARKSACIHSQIASSPDKPREASEIQRGHLGPKRSAHQARMPPAKGMSMRAGRR